MGAGGGGVNLYFSAKTIIISFHFAWRIECPLCGCECWFVCHFCFLFCTKSLAWPDKRPRSVVSYCWSLGSRGSISCLWLNSCFIWKTWKFSDIFAVHYSSFEKFWKTETYMYQIGFRDWKFPWIWRNCSEFPPVGDICSTFCTCYAVSRVLDPDSVQTPIKINLMKNTRFCVAVHLLTLFLHPLL